MDLRGPAGDLEAVAELDVAMDTAYEHAVREALNVSVCMSGTANVQGGALVLTLAGMSDEVPLLLVNDLDLVPLLRLIGGNVDTKQSAATDVKA